MSLVVTGATGQLGRLVINALLVHVPAANIVALVRNPAKAMDLTELGVIVTQGDYSRPETLKGAFSAGDKVLLISSSEVGVRVRQHQAVIDAAVDARVSSIAYTSVLHADASPLGLAKDHRQTEAAIAASGLDWVCLRNGWYTENYTGRIPVALTHHTLLGSASEGRIASAAREDYAEAAAAVLRGDFPSGSILELAGDDSYSLGEFADTLAEASGETVAYVDVPEAQYRQALVEAGLPDFCRRHHRRRRRLCCQGRVV